MADGVRSGGDAVPPRRRRAVRGAPRGAAVPQGRPHRVVPRLVRPVRRPGRLRGLPARPARHRLVGRDRHRRVPRRRARRPARTSSSGWPTQPWSSGRVGMFGTSYSGFNSLHMAAEGVPELGAVVAMYATDDRYTDDVHYRGGVLRAIDLIDYVLYMVPMNALPPVPALWGDGWRGRVAPAHRRDAGVDARLAARAGRTRRCGGAVRSGSDPATRATSGSRARRCSSPAGPTAIATTRSARSSGCACRGGCSPVPGATRIRPGRARARTSTPTARSSPSSTSTSATGSPSVDAPAQVFVRRPVRPEPDLEVHDGVWRDLVRLAAARSALGRVRTRRNRRRHRRSRGRAATSAWRRGSRAPAGCRGASRSTSAPTTPGR